MVIGYPGGHPAYPPRRAGAAPRWLPAVIGLAALGGLLATLLPMWSMGLPSLRGTLLVLGFRQLNAKSANAVQIHVGFYDWIASGRPMCAAAPVALALAVAVAVASVLSGPDRTLWGVTAAASLCALILLGATAIRPQSSRQITGPLAERMSRRDMAVIQNAGQGEIHLGSGLIIALVALAVVAGLALWQYVVSARSAAMLDATRRAGVAGP